MDKHTLFIGLDLSFNSTGLTFIHHVNGKSKSIEFHRLRFSAEPIKPQPIKGVNQHIYIMPTNFDYREMTIIDTLFEDDSNEWLTMGVDDGTGEYQKALDYEFYGIDQIYITTKLMINGKRIKQLIDDFVTRTVTKFQIDRSTINLVFNIEGNVLTGMEGGNQLRVTGGLFMLNQEVRSHIIRLKLENIYSDVKLYITSPTELKMFFANNGQATKIDMVQAFVTNWDGNKLIPETNRVSAINDVVDSFALGVLAFHKYIEPLEYFNWLKVRSPSRVKPKNKPKVKPKVVEDLNAASLVGVDFLQQI